MWPSLTIVAMWLAVLFDAIYGPSIVSTTPTTTSQIPSAVVLGLFAFFATWVVAKYGFRRDAPDNVAARAFASRSPVR